MILAPHLVKLKKKDLGLPHVSAATDRQKKDGMCWTKEDELYNDGGAFKVWRTTSNARAQTHGVRRLYDTPAAWRAR